MRLVSILFSAALALSAQSERTLTFSQTDEKDRAQTATVIRSIASPAGLEANSGSLTVRGSEEVVALAAWLFERLDGRKARAEETFPMGSEEVRLFPLRAGHTPRMVSEVTTALRAALDPRRLFGHENAGVIAIREPAALVAQLAWMLRQIQGEGSGEPRLKVAEPESVLRIYTLMLDPRPAQEVATITRSLLDVRRILTVTGWGRMMARGTPAQVRAADWLVAALQNHADAQYSMGEGEEPAVRVFALHQVENGQELAVKVRQATGVRRLVLQTSPALLAVRGTPQQMEEVAKLLAR